ncbi:MAG TPA: ATPase, T2SS/T4P/T4SS family [Patescibacteria group bacterium]|jgi:type IV pilus assembly protein PilB|nr:ATPase, T2SS/T4P/T4SS family [Patescibacteria group bacterium]
MENKSVTKAPSTHFAQFLLDHGFINEDRHEQLIQKLAAKYGGAGDQASPQEVTDLVLDQKMLDEEDVAKARAAFLNLPYVDLRNINIPQEVLSIIPEESRTFYRMIPYELKGTDLKVALEDPSHIQALEALEFLGQKANYQIHIYLGSYTSIGAALKGSKNLSVVVGTALEDIQKSEDFEQAANIDLREDQKKAALMNAAAEDAPIIKIVDVILSNAIEANASDIHIEPSENDVRVRYRIDGILHTSLRLPRNVLNAIVSRIKILSNLKIEEQRLPQDGRFHAEFGSSSVDLRVSTLPLMHGEKIVMRILDKTTSVPTLDQLGLRGKGLQWVMDSIQKTHGVFLITGPTGSGKSTTLYSILSLRNTNEVNIVTLEDPVEYFIPGVNQSQINPDIGLTFASGLRSILRQDPNIVMVGEIRDEETAELAIHAALTGHLVFSTLHTNNAVGAIPRLSNMGIEQFLLSASVNLIMAQRLVRKLCENCKKPTTLTAIAKKVIDEAMVNIPKDYLDKIDLKNYKTYEAVGCKECGDIGYKGRMGIFEVMPMLNEFQDILFAKKPAHEIYELTAKFGMITMKQDGVIKVLRGETTMDEIIRVTTE